MFFLQLQSVATAREREKRRASSAWILAVFSLFQNRQAHLPSASSELSMVNINCSSGGGGHGNCGESSYDCSDLCSCL